MPTLACAVATLLAGTAVAETAPAGCATCHGADGLGRGSSPRLAGLPQAYLRAQMRAFADGSRASAVMAPIAEGLDDAATTSLAATYAAMPSPSGGAAAGKGDSALLAEGATLAMRGAWERRVPPCASCHGRHGLGVGDAFPALVGQSATYLAAQLHAWKTGARSNDPQALMRMIAARLDENEIAAVSAYYAALAPGATP